jgi:hypothetical protein
MALPVAKWGVKEVCDWVDYIGLGQYRKRFLHHCIGGSLVLQLTEEDLKVSTPAEIQCSEARNALGLDMVCQGVTEHHAF